MKKNKFNSDFALILVMYKEFCEKHIKQVESMEKWLLKWLYKFEILLWSDSEVGKSWVLSIWYSRSTQMSTVTVGESSFFYNFHWNSFLFTTPILRFWVQIIKILFIEWNLADLWSDWLIWYKL
jgi:hypothetical protein